MYNSGSTVGFRVDCCLLQRNIRADGRHYCAVVRFFQKQYPPASFRAIPQAVASSAVVGRMGTEPLSGGTEGSHVGRGVRGQPGASAWTTNQCFRWACLSAVVCDTPNSKTFAISGSVSHLIYPPAATFAYSPSESRSLTRYGFEIKVDTDTTVSPFPPLRRLLFPSLAWFRLKHRCWRGLSSWRDPPHGDRRGGQGRTKQARYPRGGRTL